MSLVVQRGDDNATEWWAAAAEGRLVVQSCPGCGGIQHPPRAVCIACHFTGALEWRDHDGRGVLYSATQIHTTTYPDFRDRLPFWVGYAMLDEHAYLIANISLPTGVTPVVGASVRVGFERLDESVQPVLTMVEN